MTTFSEAEHMLPAFATPLINYHWQDLEASNIEIVNYILNLEKTSNGVVKSNVGGWHSDSSIFTYNNEHLNVIHSRLRALVKQLFLSISRTGTEQEFELDAWANILRYGQYNSIHSHPNALWSGIYYPSSNEKIPEHPLSGKLELIDPRPGASLSYSETTNLYGRCLLNPIAGQCILFPSWLCHQVHPYFGKSRRISVAFNVLNKG